MSLGFSLCLGGANRPFGEGEEGEEEEEEAAPGAGTGTGTGTGTGLGSAEVLILKPPVALSQLVPQPRRRTHVWEFEQQKKESRSHENE